MSDSEELFTKRLHLRPPVATDARAIIGIVGDWEVARRLRRVPYPYNQSHFDQYIENVIPYEPTWAIVSRQTNLLMGIISLIPDRERSSAELGYYLGREYWGQGHATEAGRAIVRYGFDCVGYAKLTSRYHADNSASWKVLAKLGFTSVGNSVSFCLAEGTDKPSIDVELGKQ